MEGFEARIAEWNDGYYKPLPKVPTESARSDYDLEVQPVADYRTLHDPKRRRRTRPGLEKLWRPFSSISSPPALTEAVAEAGRYEAHRDSGIGSSLIVQAQEPKLERERMEVLGRSALLACEHDAFDSLTGSDVFSPRPTDFASRLPQPKVRRKPVNLAAKELDYSPSPNGGTARQAVQPSHVKSPITDQFREEDVNSGSLRTMGIEEHPTITELMERLRFVESQLNDSLTQRQMVPNDTPTEPASTHETSPIRDQEHQSHHLETGRTAAARPEVPMRPSARSVNPASEAPHIDALQRDDQLSMRQSATDNKLAQVPRDLPRFHATIPTWTLACRAIQSSLEADNNRSKQDRMLKVASADSRIVGTIMLDEQVIDSDRLVIITVRGKKQERADDKPISMTTLSGFLDDGQNQCHAGFLDTAAAMADPLAGRLKRYEESPSKPSLLFTGHGEGGAIAALLYAHMHSAQFDSDLAGLSSCFKRIHCITFGSPPVSLLPIQRPEGKKSVFLAFVNDGDTVSRLGHQAYAETLAKLFASGLPSYDAERGYGPRRSRLGRIFQSKAKRQSARHNSPDDPALRGSLVVPPETLAHAGRVVLLRETISQTTTEVTALDCSSTPFTGILFGDSSAHSLHTYQRRVNALASMAVFGDNGGAQRPRGRMTS